MKLKHILVASFLLLTGVSISKSQSIVSAAIMQQAESELQKRGLTKDEVQSRLMQEGIDINNLSKDDMPRYQSKIITILDKMVAEKKQSSKSMSKDTTFKNNLFASPTIASPISQLPLNTTPQEAISDSIAKSTSKVVKSKIYGHNLFSANSMSVFRTIDGAQVPDTYVLGAGDEVHISIFGSSQTDIQQRIGEDGSIQPAGASKIFVKGLTLAQAREAIRKSLSTFYLFRSDQLAVTIVTARTIMVSVFGEVNNVGGYSLSALNSAVNALFVAGGPTEIGSVRNIQLIRNGVKKNIDLYSFMKDPSVQTKFDLQNNDIIFVPVAKNLVTIAGAVNRPMVYEMKENETLKDLLDFAGGESKDIYPDLIQINRLERGEPKLLEFSVDDLNHGTKNLVLQNGDYVTLKKITKQLEQFVSVEGSVYYSGNYDLTSTPNISVLLQKSKPNYQAKTDYVLLERMRPDSTLEMIKVPLSNDKKLQSDFQLKPRDKVFVLNQIQYRDLDSISVVGAVRLPFKKPMSLNDKISVRQALDMAGGVKTSVYPVAYIFRKDLVIPTQMKYIKVDLKNAQEVFMQSGDQLNVYDNKTYTNTGDIKVSGAVKQTIKLTFDTSLTVQDVLVNAGGFTIGAAYNRVEVFRTILSPTQSPKLKLITLEVDSTYKVVKPLNFTLQPYDQVVVRYTPDFTFNRSVEINGQVKYPGVYVLESKQTSLSDVIKMAGGLLHDADTYGSTLFRTYNNRGYISMNIKDAVSHPKSKEMNPILFEGDVINVNRLENTVSIIETGTRLAQYSTDNDTIKNVVFHGYHSAAWYIRHYAGGFQKNADRRSVTVTYPNNQMESTKRLFWIYQYPKVVPGSVITLQMDTTQIRQELEPKEKQDLESTLGKSLSLMMSTLSIVLLVKNLNK